MLINAVLTTRQWNMRLNYVMTVLVCDSARWPVFWREPLQGVARIFHRGGGGGGGGSHCVTPKVLMRLASPHPRRVLPKVTFLFGLVASVGEGQAYNITATT